MPEFPDGEALHRAPLAAAQRRAIIASEQCPDFDPIHREVAALLAADPKNTDYVETVTRPLRLELPPRYPGITTVAIDRRSHPTMTISHFPRAHAAAAR